MFPDVWDIFFRPLRGLVSCCAPTTPYGVGCILSPLRGCIRAERRPQLFRASVM